MTLGRTTSGAIKVKMEGGLRAVSCGCCGPICLLGDAVGRGSSGDPAGPCVHFTTATTTPAKVAGLYQCTGGVDDQGEMTWPGGSFSSPASMPSVGPCYGAHNFSFTASLDVGDTVTCNAGSWGGGIECHLSCCLIIAP